MSDPSLPFNKQPFAGSAWATNEDAGIVAADLRRRAEQGLPPPWYQPLPTLEQIRRRAVRKMVRHYRRAASCAFLAVLFVIAAVSLLLSHPVSAVGGFAGGGVLVWLSLWRLHQARRMRRALQETRTGDMSR